MTKVYMIIKTIDGSLFLLDSIKTNQKDALKRVDELIKSKEGRKARMIEVVLNRDDIEEVLNTTNYMISVATK